MAAYAAVSSHKNTIEGQLLQSSRIRPSPDIIQLVNQKLTALQEILLRLDGSRLNKSRKKINALDGRIKDEVWRFENLLEHHFTDHILSEFENHRDPLQLRRIINSRRISSDEEEVEEEDDDDEKKEKELHRSQSRSIEGEGDVALFSIDLQGQQHDVNSFIRRVVCMKEEYIYELANLPDEKEEEESIGFGGKKSNMIGSYDYFKSVRNCFVEDNFKNKVNMFLGMAGIALAEEVFDDPLVRTHFDHRVWVTVGRKSRDGEYYAHAILDQLNPNNIGKRDEKEIGEYLEMRLKGKKCLIVFDDLWETHPIDLVLSSLPKPKDKSGKTQILVSARDGNLDKGIISRYIISISHIKVQLLNEEESKNLLCMKVFGEGNTLPTKLDKVAKKIAKKCEGLPLLIVAVANRLSEGDTTEEYWNEIAEERNSVFKDALDEISKVLFPSYDYSPQNLKMLFLYLGVFPRPIQTHQHAHW